MLLAKNKQALFNYEVIEKFMAGIVLRGYEVKAVREGNVNMTGSYVTVAEDGVYVVGLHIGRYSKLSQIINDDALGRSRKLLLNTGEIAQIRRHLSEKGKTVVPLALLLKNNLVKLEIALVKGMKKHEKKVVAKEKQVKRDLEMARKTTVRSIY